MKKLLLFTLEEDGAVTTDWVLLTAGVMGLTLAVMSSTISGAQGLSETISSEVASQTIAQSF